MFQALVNNTKIELNPISSNEIEVNGKKLDLDLEKIAENKFHAILNHRSYNIETVEMNKESKTAKIKVNNKVYSVKLNDPTDILLKKLGMADMATKKITDLKAPMPGLVISVPVKPGQEITEGQDLLILEAMKMENVLKSPLTGNIKSVNVEQGQTIEKNQILITFE